MLRKLAGLAAPEALYRESCEKGQSQRLATVKCFAPMESPVKALWRFECPVRICGWRAYGAKLQTAKLRRYTLGY